MATNAELEAAIANDPDDEDAYLVYGDWLQTQDDPRGELIALQAAQLRDPTDKRIAVRIGELLARHDEALLGELGGEMDVGWHLGFVRSARLAPDKDPAKPLAALRALLAHPSGRFVQAISFAQTKGIDPKKIVKLLLQTKQPATLSELHIDATFDIETDAPELLTQFPRLNRTLDVEWKRILKLLSEQRATDLKFDVETLARLVPLPDAEVTGVRAEHVLLGLKLEIDKHKPIGMIAALKRSFVAATLDQFVVSLGQQFMLARGPANMKWGFLAIGRLGGDAAVAWIASHLGEWSHARAVQGAQLLGQIRTNTAIWELYAMVADPALNRPRRDDASVILEGIAAERRTDVDRLLDRSVPAVVPDIRKRVMRAKVHDPSSRIRDAAIRRLEAHMIDGRRIGAQHFIHHFVRHPVIAPLVQRLVWATYAGIDLETTFRIDAEGTAVDASGDPVDLDGAQVGVLHPAELEDRRAVVKRWKTALADAAIEPLFAQLDRPVHELRDGDTGPVVTRFKLRSVGFDQLRAFESVLDWAADQEDNDGGPLTIGWSKPFRRDGVVAYAGVDGGAIGQVTATRGGKRVRFDALHPVTASEILLAVDRATTRERERPVEEEPPQITKGMWVAIGTGPHRTREGFVFWIGSSNNLPRVGIKTDNDETLWANMADVVPTQRRTVTAAPEVIDEVAGDAADRFLAAADIAPAKPALEKGTKVSWSKGRHRGTGTVFWLGQNKFGEGMRAGVKDDETGETVWADADDCIPV